MNLKRRFSMLPAACLAGLLFVGCTTETTETHYVKLSEVACTFLGEGGPKVITVEANPGYEVSSSASWLKGGDEGESSFSLTADANDSGSERVAEVTVTAGEASVVISVNQLPSDSEMAHYRLLNKFNYGAVVSPNGRYAGGSYQTRNNDDTYNYHVVIIDLETEEWHEVGEFHSSLYKPTIPSCITDDGTLFFSEYNTYGNLVSTLSGDNYLLEKAYPDWIGEANVEATTADGTVWVGYQQWMNGDDAMEAGYDGGHYMPIKWTNGEPEILPLPEKNYRNEPWPYGRSVMARGVSYDGSVIYGSAWDNTNQGMVYWKDGEVHWAGEDIREFEEVTLIRQEDGKEVPFTLTKGLMVYAERTNISPNGKWLCAAYAVDTATEGMHDVITSKCPAFFNTETGKTYIFDEYSGSARSATDDGIGFIVNSGGASGYVVDIESGTQLGTTEQWIYDNYGITVPAGYIQRLCPNGMVLGYSVMNVGPGLLSVAWYVRPAEM